MMGNVQPASDGAPRSATNGTAPHHPHTNGIAGTQPSAAARPSLPRYHFPDVCHKLRRKVFAFLDQDIPASDELLRSVQSQVRISVDVIEQALRRYR